LLELESINGIVRLLTLNRNQQDAFDHGWPPGDVVVV
jgi:hypothetical protein